MKMNEADVINKFILEEAAIHTARAWEGRQGFRECWDTKAMSTSAEEMNGERVELEESQSSLPGRLRMTGGTGI